MHKKILGFLFSFIFLVMGLLVSNVSNMEVRSALAAGIAESEPDPVVLMETSLGNIYLILDERKAPITVSNFIEYVKSGFYDGTIFHRVIPKFMIQGGGFDANMKEKDTRAEIKNEANNGLKNRKYTIAMARKPDPHSASAQFFINVQDNNFLDFTSKETPRTWGYAVFGKVVRGKEVVEAIVKVPTKRRGIHEDVPVTPVIIKKMVVLKDGLPDNKKK